MRLTVSVLLSIVTAATCLLAGNSGVGSLEGADLVISVKQPRDRTQEIVPGSHWYVADLLNRGQRPYTLEAIQMPGGYAGSGKFFVCNLEVWDADRRNWKALRTEKAFEFGHHPEFVGVEVKPGEHLEACAMLLPSQAGANGQCIRFLIQTKRRPHPHGAIRSGPFVIGKKAASPDAPCR